MPSATVVLEKTLKSPLDFKEIKPVNPKENQLWIFIGRTDTEAEVSILWPPDVKSQLIRKDSDSKRVKAEGEWDNRERDGWVALLTQWTWIWANSRIKWRTGKPGVLQSMGSQRVRHDRVNNNNRDFRKVHRIPQKKSQSGLLWIPNNIVFWDVQSKNCLLSIKQASA